MERATKLKRPAQSYPEGTEEVLKRFNLTWAEVKEYARLKAEIYGQGGPFKQLFVQLDDKNPAHVRFNELSGKMIHLHAHLITQRRA